MDPMPYILEVKHHFRNERGSYEVFLKTMTDFNTKKIDANRLIKLVMKLFHGHNNLILGFNKFLPKQYKIVPEDDVEALNFIKKVRKMFKDDHGAFSNFLQIIATYRRKNKSIIKVNQEIFDLFRGHDDLLVEFKRFLPHTNDIMHAKKKHGVEDKSAEKRVCGKGVFFDKVKALRDSDISQELMKYVELYSNKTITRVELQELVDDLIGEYPELVKGFDEFMENTESITKSKGAYSSKTMVKNIEELDLSKCQQITPSYRLLPMNCRSPAIRHESLNDGFVCVAGVKGEFKIRLKNKCEDNLFECEDHIFELDMKMHLISETVLSTEDLLRKMGKNHKLGKNHVLCLEEHFKGQKLGCIKRLFDDRDPKFLDSLRSNPHILLPIVLKRLILEQMGLKEIYEDFEIGWRRIFRDNHRGSLGLLVH